jgi:CHAT domain
MAARVAAGAGALGELLRERQDLIAQRQAREVRLVAALSAARPNEAEIKQIRADLSSTDARLSEQTVRLERERPDFGELTTPKPLSINEVQNLLAPNEVLVAILPGPGGTALWSVTREEYQWHELPVGAGALDEKIAALRSGLEIDDLKKAAAEGKLFDLGLAHQLYELLLGPLAESLKSKDRIILVPSGALTSLPFHLLVTSKPSITKPTAEQVAIYRDAAWLVRTHAVTVLPSVSSLRALRVWPAAAKPQSRWSGSLTPCLARHSRAA